MAYLINKIQWIKKWSLSCRYPPSDGLPDQQEVFGNLSGIGDVATHLSMAYLINAIENEKEAREKVVATHLPMAYLNNECSIDGKSIVDSRYPPSDGLPEQRKG